MNTFYVAVFLTSSVYNDKITSSLVSGGFTVGPGFPSGNTCLRPRSGSGTVLAIIITTDRFDNQSEMSHHICFMLEKLNIPYFGIVVNQVGIGMIGAGWAPDIKPNVADAPDKKNSTPEPLKPKDPSNKNFVSPPIEPPTIND